MDRTVRLRMLGAAIGLGARQGELEPHTDVAGGSDAQPIRQPSDARQGFTMSSPIVISRRPARPTAR